MYWIVEGIMNAKEDKLFLRNVRFSEVGIIVGKTLVRFGQLQHVVTQIVCSQPNVQVQPWLQILAAAVVSSNV